MSSRDPTTIEEMEQRVKELTDLVEQLGDTGRYAEADRENKKLEALKKRLSEKRKTALEEEQREHEEELHHAYEEQVKLFADQWDEEMKNFENDASKQIEELKNTHQQQNEALELSFASADPPQLKPSPELVSLRATEKQLAKLKKFQEALKAQAAADALEQEKVRLEKEEATRKNSLKQQLKAQQSSEMSNLLKRIDRERKEKCIQRGNDSARLEQRYRNLLRELRAEQKAQANEFQHGETMRKSKEAGKFISSPFRPSSSMNKTGTRTGSMSPAVSGSLSSTSRSTATPQRSTPSRTMRSTQSFHSSSAVSRRSAASTY
ncbi:uncharacterized protein MONOS_6787 [Monocercomonoides exilis]|uniref:uncharacterized protein n=1 Tax=Monocercomonoides exilis TaxID=2049356 RepID=UPI003559864E|nr:hypothetical protein MONOS_6787 [Monocercomonoides exilis]